MRQENGQKGLIWELMYHIVSFVLTLILLPLVLPFLLIFRFYRRYLYDRINKTHSDVIIADPNDAIWFQDCHTNKAIISALLLFKGKPDIKRLQETLLTRLVKAKKEDGTLLFPKFTRYSKKIMHRDVWVEEEKFDINDHVFKWDKSLPKSKSELESLLSYLCSQPLPEKKAYWQIIIVPTIDRTEEQFYMVFRIHHAVADGISLTRVLMTKVVDVPPEQHRPVRFGAKNHWMRAIKSLFTGPALMFTQFMRQPDKHALHGPLLSGDKVVAWSDQLDLAMIKRMKKAAGCTVNDVVMSCLAGAFQEHFKRNSSVMPADIKAFIPVDIRSNHNVSLDNQLSLVVLSLPLDVEDQMHQLKETKSRMDNIKNSAEPLLAALVMQYLMARLPSWLSRLLFNFLCDKCSMVLSNVPGPQTKLFLAGYALEDVMFWPPQRSNVGMGVSVMSYNGHVKLAVMCDRMILSNPSVLVTSFENKIHQLAKNLSAL